jgi:hypothetical protein
MTVRTYLQKPGRITRRSTRRRISSIPNRNNTPAIHITFTLCIYIFHIDMYSR